MKIFKLIIDIIVLSNLLLLLVFTMMSKLDWEYFKREFVITWSIKLALGLLGGFIYLDLWLINV